ncbi:hypothetical protein COOONC_00785 [Cooperia oncophora]
MLQTKYTRLAGKYGVCVNDPSEVKAYYYDGMYTTDGCLRSCYQDMILEECQCMDPRYPVAPGAITCELAKRSCIDEAVAKHGKIPRLGTPVSVPCHVPTNSTLSSGIELNPLRRSLTIFVILGMRRALYLPLKL